MKRSVTQRLNRDLLITVGIITLLFIAAGVIIQLRWNNEKYHQISLLLDTLAARENDHLANELFERRIQALDMRLAEISLVEGVQRVTLYDAQGRALAIASNGLPNAGMVKDIPLIQIEEPRTLRQYRADYEWHTMRFLRPVSAIGEVMGWLEINYDLSMLRKQVIEFFLFYFMLMALILLCMLTILRRRIASSLVRPLRDLGMAMEALQAAERTTPPNPSGGSLQNADMEVAQLWESFQNMALRLNTSYRELAEAGRTMRESERRFKSIFDNAPYAITINSFTDGRYLDVNDAYLKSKGLNKERALALSKDEISRTLPDQQTLILDQIRQGGVFNVEGESSRHDGSIAHVLFSAVPIPYGDEEAILSMVVDITEQKKIQEALAASEKMFSELFIFSPDGILLSSGDTDRILEVNEAFLTTFGYEREELIGRSTMDLDLFEDERQQVQFIKQLKTTGRLKNFETQLRKKNGQVLIYSINSKTLTIDNQPVYLTIGRDVTEQKKMQGMMIQTEKMVSLGSVAAGIAHDFNNILSGIMGFTDLAMLEAADNEKLNRYLNQVSLSSMRARDLVRHILAFSRKSEADKRPLKIDPIVHETIKFIRASLPANIEIRHDLKVQEGHIFGDATQLHQILMNLFTNAGHAMKDKGGILEVFLDRVTLEESQTDYFERISPGTYLQLSVSDTGCGIPEKVMDRIFDPFFTTKARGEGTGMGLATVYGILKEMGGGISVDSKEGVGPTFQILIPEHDQRETKKTFKRTLKTGCGNILVVDDEKPIIESISALLSKLGYTVTGENNGVKAFEMVKDNPHFYDLILTDMMMPDINGLDLAKRIKEINADIPIVLCTGFSHGLTKEKCMEAGIVDMVMKPMIADELSLTVDRAIKLTEIVTV